MNAVLTVLLLSFLLFTQTFSSIKKDREVWTNAELEKANTAARVDYMSSDEKRVLMLINLARLDGKRFFDTYIDEFLKLHNQKYRKIWQDNDYVISLQNDLAKIRNLPMLYPDKSLYRAASYHAEDLGKKGTTGHSSSDGTSFAKRVERFAGKRYSTSENISYGFADPLGIVGQLLVDEGIPSLGHRTNILRETDRFVGIAIRSHARWGSNCVMDFSAEPFGERKMSRRKRNN